MHLVLLNDDVLPSARGGSAVVAQWQREEMKKRGYDVTLITTHQDGTQGEIRTYADASGHIISIGLQYPLARRHRLCVRNPTIAPIIRTLLGDLQPDIVHAHNLHTYLTYESLTIARTFTSKIFLTAHDTFLVSFHRVGGERFFASVREKRPLQMHWYDHLRAVGRRYAPLRNRAIRRMLSSSGTTVITISHCLQEFLNVNGIEKTIMLHNGVPLQPLPAEDVQKRTRARFGLTGPTILFGGRVGPDKGMDALLQSFATVSQQLSTAQLLIAGDKDRVGAELLDLPPDLRKKIVVSGWVSPEDMTNLYAACDLVTTPSVYLDAFNLMNAEAMAAGKPVVGTCFGGTPEIVEDGVTGRIVDPRDTVSYAEALTMMLRDPAKGAAMGMAGRARIAKHFSLQKQIDGLEALYAHS